MLVQQTCLQRMSTWVIYHIIMPSGLLVLNFRFCCLERTSENMSRVKTQTQVLGF